MSKPIEPPVQPVIPSNTVVVASPEIQQLQAELLREQLAAVRLERRQLEKAQAIADENERINDEARRQSAAMMQKRANDEARVQEMCPHRKPNNQTALSGQRDHNGHLILICPYCSAKFDEKTVPPFLIPDPQLIGGPQLGAL